MKKYIKPSTTIMDVETQQLLAAVSGENQLEVTQDATNDINRSKNTTLGFNVWGEDEE